MDASLCLVYFAACAATAGTIALVPAPEKLESGESAFIFNADTRLLFLEEAPGGEATAHFLAEALRPAMGFALPVSAGTAADVNAVLLRSDASDLGAEGYRLDVDADRVTIAASQATGLFYGAQTLRQLLPAAVFSAGPVSDIAWAVPAVRIEDRPRFGWRGLLLDPARHFIPKESVKKFMDVMALHKMNRLHLHLTDDQGWRVEIKKYPKLTEIGAWRAETLVGHLASKTQEYDGTPHGGFYTQEDLRELVAYAAARHITLVPEIEMPGHAQAAIAAYPELGNVSEPLPVLTKWGVNPNIFNAEESTILFLQDVLAEVADIFPGPYIHIGGDEAVKDQWKSSEAIQQRIRELGLEDETALQAWFIARMNTFLKERGKTLIGWDEILDGGLGQDAVVMAWRSVEKGVEAARAGNRVIMAPTKFTYLDYYQGKVQQEPLGIGGFLPLERVYAFNPIPEGLTAEEEARILGAQGQLWSEYIPNPEHLEYMAFPRACALAEAAWTPQEQRDYKDFLARLQTHLDRLDHLAVQYRPLDP